MRLMIIAFIFMMACGPVRKRFLAGWTFTFPALLGGIIAWRLLDRMFPVPVPW